MGVRWEVITAVSLNVLWKWTHGEFGKPVSWCQGNKRVRCVIPATVSHIEKLGIVCDDMFLLLLTIFLKYMLSFTVATKNLIMLLTGIFYCIQDYRIPVVDTAVVPCESCVCVTLKNQSVEPLKKYSMQKNPHTLETGND